MIRDFQWMCPVCQNVTSGVRCNHGGLDGFANGITVWYGGRLLHFSPSDVQLLRFTRFCAYKDIFYDAKAVDYLRGLGFISIDRGHLVLTAEGENLCRHADLSALDGIFATVIERIPS